MERRLDAGATHVSSTLILAEGGSCESGQVVAQVHALSDVLPMGERVALNIETLRPVAETGVDVVSSSSLVTRSTWLDLSMNIVND